MFPNRVCHSQSHILKTMIREILLVGSGSFAGGVARYLVSLALKWNGEGFPVGTFVVNIVGSLLIGLLIGLLARHPSAWLNQLLVVGFCGGFTTCATVSLEVADLASRGAVLGAVGYAALTCCLCVLAAFAGGWLARA